MNLENCKNHQIIFEVHLTSKQQTHRENLVRDHIQNMKEINICRKTNLSA